MRAGGLMALQVLFSGTFSIAAGHCPPSPIQSLEGQRAQQKVRLPIEPVCGSIDSENFTNINTGVCLSQAETLFTFGDSYTSNGNFVGGKPGPLIADGTSPYIGGRASNGPTYPEYLQPKVTIRNYAQPGATVDRRLWSRRKTYSDMISHVETFLSQQNFIYPATSIAILFYGINDMGSRADGPGTMQRAAQEWLVQTELLIQAGLNQFVIISVPDDEPDSREYGNIIWQGIKELRDVYMIDFAYVDLMAFWRHLLRTPEKFGFETIDPCLKNSKTTVGGCAHPEKHVFWTPGHPQTLVHKLIADWIKTIMNNCAP